MRLYVAVAVSTFRRYTAYRAATAAGVFTNIVFGFIVAYAYMALWHERPNLGGYGREQALTFVWISQALAAAMALLGGGFQEELQERIRTGEIAIDLSRPVDMQLWWLACDLGRAVFHLLSRGVVPLAVGALAFRLALPQSPLMWLAFLLSALLGAVVSFALRYLVALSSFWLLDGAGVNMVNGLLTMFFSGMLLPLTVFPGAFGETARLLPWAAVLQTPADVLLGRHHGSGLGRALLFQAGWVLVLLSAGRAMQLRATQRTVVQGG
ncbi:ABC transporter permease [Streptomyces pathocidini]|uniref:ABC transporter permease n=1 Tax=Streptomyces pathocidini TaxID=1650571 RepID=A0ABW7UVD4_9ACTN|nr:ABC-2 family transporter protein [Streptomyces pathocidini]